MPQVVGKIKICSCKNYRTYFKSTQGLEGRTLFERYEAIENIINRTVNPEFKDFIAQPVFDGDHIHWFAKPFKETPKVLSELPDDLVRQYQPIKEKTLKHYMDVCESLRAQAKTDDAKCLEGAIRFINDDFIFCYDGRVVLGIWGMQLKDNVRESTGIIEKSYGHKIPVPPNGSREDFYTVSFDATAGGSLKGTNEIRVRANEAISSVDIPEPEPQYGFEFEGWDKDPYTNPITGDTVFTAKFKKSDIISGPDEREGEGQTVPGSPDTTPAPEPWWRRWWAWFTGAGCLKWLLYFLLILLLLLLLLWLFKGCNTRSYNPIPYPISEKPWVKDDSLTRGGIYNPGKPYDPVPTPPEYASVLPPEQGVLLPIDTANIIHKPDRPSVLANRLNILMENTDKSILDFASEFKKAYPGEQYKIVYYDDVVKRIQIEVPAAERESLKSQIPAKFAPAFSLFVFDESLFEGVYTPADPAFSEADKAWYLKAIGAEAAWDISRGSQKLTLAIVDDGFNLRHAELKDKVVMPYNVWLHNDEVSPQADDHGTHVAGTAIATMDNGEGLCGIAPVCAFMPVQVADQNGIMTTTSVLDGVLYALYQGADVINISLGLQYTAAIPGNLQQELQDNHFKEEERLWNFIMKIADKHNAILVTAAGNENMLAGIDPMHRPKNFIVVSATDQTNNPIHKANFSNYGDYSTISAPGTNIFSSVGRSDYTFMSGTSMAAPIVSGTVALMKSLNNGLTASQIICVLQQTGLHLNDQIGPLVQVDKALQMVKSGAFSACDSRPEVPSSGDVQVLLSWNNYNDLDLVCVDPNGEAVWFKNRRVASGGQLEIDMNVNYPDSKTPIENIYWPSGGAPDGTYNVYLIYYKKHIEINETQYEITVKYSDKTDKFAGQIKIEDNSLPICSFNLGMVSNSSSPSGIRKNELWRKREKLQNQLNKIDQELREY